jgi:hypothetical protein
MWIKIVLIFISILLLLLVKRAFGVNLEYFRYLFGKSSTKLRDKVGGKSTSNQISNEVNNEYPKDSENYKKLATKAVSRIERILGDL